VGLRKLLTRQPAEDPLERLAELGREGEPEATLPRWPVAELTTQDEAAPLSLASVDKKPVDVFAAKTTKAVDPPRSRSGYVWRSQAGRESRSSAVDFANRTF
jgi:hypothetical protein